MGDKVFLLLFFVFLTINGQSTSPNLPSEKEVSTNKEENSSTSPSDLAVAESSAQVFVNAPDGKEDTEKSDNNNITFPEEKDVETEDFAKVQDIIRDLINSADDDSSSASSSSEIEDLFPSNSEKEEVRQESEGNTAFEQENTPGMQFGESPENRESLSSSSPQYEPANSQVSRNEPEVESSPVLQLTQGGYQALHSPTDRFNDQRPGLRSESATEQSGRLETPEGNSGPGGRSRFPFQNPFAPFLQAPFTLATSPVFRHPFENQQQGLPNGNSAIQNSFYNTQPELNQQYSQLENAGDFPNVHFTIQTAPRIPPQHHPFLYQSPFQIPASPPMPVDSARQFPSLFQTGGSPGYSNYDRSAYSVPPDFTALFGNPMSQMLPPQGNPYGVNPNLGGNVFANQPMNLMSTFPNTNQRSQFSPRLISRPFPNGQRAPQGRNAEMAPDLPPKEIAESEAEQRNESPVEIESEPAPYGARIPKQTDEENQTNVERQDDMYIRYPLKEAGYATEEALPAENETKITKEGEEPQRQRVSFFAVPPRYNIFNGPDPYKIALENVQREYPNGRLTNGEDKNDTKESQSEEFIRNLALGPNQPKPQEPSQIFRAYPERNQELSVPSTPFFPLQGSDRNPFEPLPIFPNNPSYPYIARPPGAEEAKVTPACAKKTNSSICFEDPEYPRGEIIYALNSDSYMMDRLVMPNQQLEGIPLVESNKTENLVSEDNYVCKSSIKYAPPLRARNIEGDWKVIVNIKRAMGRGKFVQPIRLEICKGVGESCSSTQPKTACVQKYSLQRLLSWSVEKGVHNDVYRLPVACSCQILDEKEE